MKIIVQVPKMSKLFNSELLKKFNYVRGYTGDTMLKEIEKFQSWFFWPCHTTRHSTTPHPMKRARRWCNVVTLLYDLCFQS